MQLGRRAAGNALLWIFVASGIAGLIYQSVWSHYLGLTLGHAAYAQTLVLGIFMGGMAMGAWWAGRRTARWRHLVLAYAVIEGVIGLAGLVFHPLFQAYTDLSQGFVLPWLGSEWLVRTWQWTSAALLIAPQCILLGATFPLLSAGYLRMSPASDGEVLGGLYFTNSIGAAFGALLATFYLLPAVGMPGAITTAAVLNLIVAAAAWAVWRMAPDLSEAAPRPQVPAAMPGDEGVAGRQLAPILLAAAFITGASSFFYEITWVRLLNMALGTSVHSFELMLAAFIAGLAFGGYWVRRRSHRIRDAIAYAGFAQLLMGVAALVSIVVFANAFDWVGWMLGALDRTSAGYTLFTLGSAGVALLVMFPAAFFAGMTLPLFTMALLRHGAGESAIGRIYAANTLGAITGVLLVVHVAIPLVGLRISLWLAAFADLALGVYLLRMVSPARWTPAAAVAAVVAAVVALGTLSGARFEPRELAAGVFRTGQASLDDDVTVAYLRDGKTATITVSADSGGAATISTNGKPDAGLMLSLDHRPRSDEVTMIMAAALPLALHPDPRRVAVIGWGSGLTTHTLLGSSHPEVVETIEIEEAMVEGARLFGERVARAYEDSRSVLRIEDARTYFAAGQRSFDVVVSEPSNPWVTGVASLFTVQFYEFVKRHLPEDGMLVQWLHTYELNDRLLATMVSALIEVFPKVDVYVTNSWDLLLVARPDEGSVAGAHWNRLQEAGLSGELARVGLAGPADFAVRRVGDERVLATLAAMYGATPHSDYYPTVSLQGPQARFMRQFAGSLQSLVDIGLPVLDALGVREPPGIADRVSSDPNGRFAVSRAGALAVREALLAGQAGPGLFRSHPDIASAVATLLTLTRLDAGTFDVVLWSSAASELARRTIGLLPSGDLAGVWIEPSWISDAVRADPTAMLLMDTYAAAAARDGARLEHAAAELLELGPGAVADSAREQALVLAMLALAMQGEPDRMDEIDDAIGGDVKVSARLGFLRSFLRAWAITQEQG